MAATTSTTSIAAKDIELAMSIDSEVLQTPAEKLRHQAQSGQKLSLALVMVAVLLFGGIGVGLGAGLASPSPPPWEFSSDWASLTAGVTAIDYGGGSSSQLVVYGAAAFPLVLDHSGAASEATVAAAVGCADASPSSGCVLLGGHESFLGPDSAGQRILRNALTWRAWKGGGAALNTVSVGLSQGSALSALETYLTDQVWASPASPPHLPCISAASPPHLRRISPVGS
jgi:hypothetical protein